MWIFLSDAMLSIVQKPGDTLLTVRARAKEDITRIFPGAKVVSNHGTDYAYRTRLPHKTVADAIAKEIMSIDYGNFKDTVVENDRYDAYLGAWSSMMRFQVRRHGPRKNWRQYGFDYDE